GDPQSISRITQSDLQAYYDIHYTPANMSVVCVGGLQLAEVVKLLTESPFATDKRGSRTPLPAYVPDIHPPFETRYVLETSEHIPKEARFQTGGYRSVAVIPGNVYTPIRILCG